MPPLTDRQTAVLSFIRDFTAANGVAPPVECEAFISANGFPCIQGLPREDGTYPEADAHVRFKCLLVPIERMPEVGAVEAFAALREAAGDRFDDIDPDEFVREVRYGDEDHKAKRLHDAIMNLECPDNGYQPGGTEYQRGHRDARHAAAELALKLGAE